MKTLALAAALLAIGQTVFAQSVPVSAPAPRGEGGGMDGGGGNLRRIREERIRLLLTRANSDLTRFMDAMAPDQIAGKAVQDAYRELLAKDLRGNVAQARIEIASICWDKHGRLSTASARIGDFGGPICMNLTELVDSNADERDVYSLLIHEMAHQLGYGEDDAVRLGESVAPHLAAFAFHHPADPAAPVLVPTDPNQRECLNVANVWFNMLQGPAAKWFTVAAVDVEGVEGLEGWQRKALHPFYMPLLMSYQAGFGDQAIPPGTPTGIYQVGCERIIVENPDPKTTAPFHMELKIVAYTKNSIEFEYELPKGAVTVFAVKKARFFAPEGETGGVLYNTSEMELDAYLFCPDSSMDRKTSHRLSLTTVTLVGPQKPKTLPITTRFQEAQSAANVESTNWDHSPLKDCKTMPYFPPYTPSSPFAK